MTTVEVTREAVIELVKHMPDDKLSSLYDFGRYIMRPASVDAPDFLRATPEELAAEDAEWDAALQSDPEALARLAENALKAHHDGKTTGISADSDELQPAPAHAIAS